MSPQLARTRPCMKSKALAAARLPAESEDAGSSESPSRDRKQQPTRPQTQVGRIVSPTRSAARSASQRQLAVISPLPKINEERELNTCVRVELLPGQSPSGLFDARVHFAKVYTKDRYKTVTVAVDDCLECLAERLLRTHKQIKCKDDVEALATGLQDIYNAQLKKQQAARQGSRLAEARY